MDTITGNLQIRSGNRWYVAGQGKPPRVGKTFSVPLTQLNTAGDFQLIAGNGYPSDPTYFQAYVSGKDLHLVVYFTDTTNYAGRTPERSNESIEIFFDFLHDHIGYFQFIFTPETGPDVHHHLPYDAAKSSAFRPIRVNAFDWQRTVVRGNNDTIRRLHAVFPADDVFRNGPVCGLNVCRFRPEMVEASSWNRVGGMGFSDATSFGHLYRGDSAVSAVIRSSMWDRGSLRIEGSTVGGSALSSFVLLDPLGKEVPVTFQARGGKWSLQAQADPALAGRYRLYPKSKDPHAFIEPGFFFLDRVGTGQNKFKLSMTWDLPDDLIATHYTPERLDNEIATLAHRGIQRIYWLEYGDVSDHPALWKTPFYGDVAARTSKECGYLTSLAARISKKHNVEFFPILKPYDLGDNRGWGWVGVTSVPSGVKLIKDIDNRYFGAIPGIAAHREATIRANPAWIYTPQLPVTRLRVFSREPVPRIKPSQVRLWVSTDNRSFSPYKGQFSVKQGKRTVPNCRWTPAGNKEEPGSRPVWCLELAGLKLKSPYAALTLEGGNCAFRHQEFLFFDATDASGKTFSPHLGEGNMKQGFLFGIAGTMWANSSEAFLRDRVWTGSPLAFTLLPRTDIPTLLEPASATGRDIWLGWVKRIVNSGADGVDIRFTCHHNGCSEYLRYAFGEDVRNEFKTRFGRDVEPTDADAVEVRRIRGEGITEFLRQAKKLTSAAGKKLVIHLEPGIEIPAEYDTKMQYVRDWKQWIEEGIPDALTLKGWTPQSQFIHENVLPLARSRNIETHLVYEVDSRSGHNGPNLTAALATDARKAGFDGYIYYETWSYYRLDPAGNVIPRGNAEATFQTVNEAMRCLEISPGS